MSRALLYIPMVLASAATAQPDEVLRTDYLGHEIILLDDGTWRFSNPSTTLSTATDTDTCLSHDSLNVRLCDLVNDWQPVTSVVEPGYSERHFVLRQNTQVSLRTTINTSFGHDGTPELYMSESPLIDGLVGLVARASGLDRQQYRSFLLGDDVLVDETISIDAGYGNYYVSVMGDAASFDLDVTYIVDYSGLDEISANETYDALADQIDAVHARLAIGGRSFNDILQAEGLTPLHGQREVE